MEAEAIDELRKKLRRERFSGLKTVRWLKTDLFGLKRDTQAGMDRNKNNRGIVESDCSRGRLEDVWSNIANSKFIWVVQDVSHFIVEILDAIICHMRSKLWTITCVYCFEIYLKET